MHYLQGAQGDESQSMCHGTLCKIHVVDQRDAHICGESCEAEVFDQLHVQDP